jgi:hypothetical protein
MSRTMRRMVLVLALVAVAVLLPGTGQATPPESDGSTYTWEGAAKLTVDVKPWGGGYVRSDPYLIDCPGACIRSFDQGREVKLTAYMTPGHTFKGWEGACAGQGNPCTLKLSGTTIDVTAVLTGQYVAPRPPSPPPSQSPVTPPAAATPSLSVAVAAGDCNPMCFTMDFTGTSYNPNSPIDITFAYVTPDAGTGTDNDAVTSNGVGAWTQGYYENCLFDTGLYSGSVVADVTATDAQGASASTQVNGTCP